jgi:tyrosyl-tRNA synthetase
MNVIEELRWRGLIHEIVPGTEAHLNAHPTSVYLGVDPTGDSMHIGNLVPVMMMVHLQRAGHRPYALVGGATGRVGDPSGKDKERQLLDEETIERNVMGIRNQLERFLDFTEGDNRAMMVNNYDWLGSMGFLDFLRDVGKHLTINYMMSKESVKKRIASESGISYTEFAYQLLQGYDFLHLYQHHGVQMQVGGSDQWGNITTGTELIRRKLGHEAETFAAVCPLMTREDGSKFGKTAEGQSVWLDAEKTSPYEFYQYWLNVGDSDAASFIKIFTLKDQAEIEALIEAHAEVPHQRGLQKALAEDITRWVHGEAGLGSALKLTEFLFGKNTSSEALADLSIADWRAVAKASSDIKVLSREALGEGMNVVDLLVELGITASKGEARRAIEKDHSVSVNATRCQSAEQIIPLTAFFHQRYLQVQRGKKNRFIVELTQEA